MNRSEIVSALTDLASELQRRNISAEMYVVGGAAIALAFDERRATRDIDAVFEPKNAVYEAAAVVAAERDLPAGWLRLLADALGIESAGEVLAIAEETFGDRLDAAARFFVEEIFASG